MHRAENLSPGQRRLKLKKAKKLGKIAKRLASTHREVIHTRQDNFRPEIRHGKPTGNMILAKQSLRLKKKKTNKKP